MLVDRTRQASAGERWKGNADCTIEHTPRKGKALSWKVSRTGHQRESRKGWYLTMGSRDLRIKRTARDLGTKNRSVFEQKDGFREGTIIFGVRRKSSDENLLLGEGKKRLKNL